MKKVYNFNKDRGACIVSKNEPNTNCLKKNLIDNNAKIILFIVLSAMLSSGATFATTTMYYSNTVYYDNSTSEIQSSNVQGAIDELYACASNYSLYNTRLTNAEATIGSSTLTTSVQTLTGGINEINSKLNNAYGGYTPSITCNNSSFAVDNVDFRYRASGGLLWISGRFRIVTAATSNPSAIYIALPSGYTSFGNNVGSCGSVHLDHAYTGRGLSLRVGGSTYIWIQSDAGNLEAGTLIGTGYVIVDAVVPIIV